MDFSYNFSQSECSNESHQLLITPSKHFCVSFDGTLNYRKTLFKVSLKNLRLAPEEQALPVVHYILRDKFSNAFYAESYVPNQMPPLEEFLHRAWSWKTNYLFAGLPKYLSVPSYARSQELSKLLANLNIEQFLPRFVNEIGLKGMQIYESELIKYAGLKFVADVQNRMDIILKEINHFRTPNKTLKSEKYEDKWINNVKEIVLPPELEVMKEAMTQTIELTSAELCVRSYLSNTNLDEKFQDKIKLTVYCPTQI